MSERNGYPLLAWALFFVIIILTGLDLLINFLSFIPFIGGLFETIGELILELIGIFVTLILTILAVKK